MQDRPWWRSAVVYQIYPRSFADGDGDGIGDLAGIRRRLEHLAWLGVDAVWLSPIFRSPMADFGYDVSDYRDIDPLFGTLAEFDALLAEAHARGLRVLLDWVPNHTSDRHPWFVESRRSRTSAKRDWYVWRDPAPGGGPPNNWVAAFGAHPPAWTFDPATGQYYLHQFLAAQPDLDWSNPAVEAAMHDELRFWLDRGVDGFRIDVVHGLGKDPALPDEPPEHVGVPHAVLNDHASVHPILRRLRAMVDRYPGDRVLVGEVFLLASTGHSRYYGRGDELQLVFELPAAVMAPWDAGAWRERLAHVAALDAIDAWPTWVLSNHDVPRHRSRFGSEARARAAAVLLLTLRGTPFLYAGEELGLADAEIPPARRVDPGGRDGCRAPLPWTAAPAHGWSGETPWLPWPPEPEVRNVETLQSDPGSILHLYRRLLGLRRESPALRLGTCTPLDAPDGILAYERAAGGDRRIVLVNFTGQPRAFAAYGVVALASDGRGEGGAFTGVVPPDGALLLEPKPHDGIASD